MILYYPNGIHTANWYPVTPPAEAPIPLAPLVYGDYAMSPVLQPVFGSG